MNFSLWNVGCYIYQLNIPSIYPFIYLSNLFIYCRSCFYKMCSFSSLNVFTICLFQIFARGAPYNDLYYLQEEHHTINCTVHHFYQILFGPQKYQQIQIHQLSQEMITTITFKTLSFNFEKMTRKAFLIGIEKKNLITMTYLIIRN